ncbi:hypothetical protein CTH30272_00738 [Allocatenococcus thiocycli]|nr:hypothetical protein CTH30272_00738 [Catenococcus thiocycli]
MKIGIAANPDNDADRVRDVGCMMSAQNALAATFQAIAIVQLPQENSGYGDI